MRRFVLPGRGWRAPTASRSQGTADRPEDLPGSRTGGNSKRSPVVCQFPCSELSGFDLKTAYDGVFTDAAAFNRKVRLFWQGAGSAEERFATAIQRMHEALDQAGIQHVVYESPGTAHEWQTWRRCLYDFAPRLFQAE